MGLQRVVSYTKKKLDNYFEKLIEDSLKGDDYAKYASFSIDAVCFRKGSDITIEQMDSIISSYKWPHEFSERLHSELRSVLTKNNINNLYKIKALSGRKDY